MAEKRQVKRREVKLEDFPLSEVPMSERKDFWSVSLVLIGFTFFVSTMVVGGKLGNSFRWGELVTLIIIGNLLLGGYVAVLGYIAYKSGLSTVLLGRFCFGDWGSKWLDSILVFAAVGWYAWHTAFIAIVLDQVMDIPEGWKIPLMVVFGFAFCWTAYVGYRGLDILSKFTVPLMIVLIIMSMTVATEDAGGLAGIMKIEPTAQMSVGVALTMIFGSFVAGGTQATNWTRFSRTAFTAVVGSLLAFFIGNAIMLFAGAYGALIYQEPDIVIVLKIQGLLSLAIVMLFANVWTTQDNTIYNFSVAGCNMFRTEKRRYFTLVGAAIGTLLAILGMYNWLTSYLLLLGTFIPPIGGVIMADFFVKYRGKYPKLSQVRFQKFNFPGILGYIMGAALAKFSPGIPPINGIIGAFVGYAVFYWIFKAYESKGDKRYE